MMGPAWANWTALNAKWADSWPNDQQEIYAAYVTVDEKGNMKEVLSEPTWTVFTATEDWVNWWLESVSSGYGKEVVILWQPVPPAPYLPKCWRLLHNVRCENYRCEYYDDSYCLNGPVDCPQGIANQEFSAIF